MSQGNRVVRGMLGMGLTFSVGVGIIATIIALMGWMLSGFAGEVEMIRLVAASALWAFPVGVAFSGLLALTARGRSFDELSLPRFALLGAGGGILLFGALATNAYDAWSWADALGNLVIFLLLGSGSATASLMLARRAGATLEPGIAPDRLPENSEAP